MGNSQKPRVALLVTCLVDMFRPEIGFASLRLLELAGCEVDVPESQTCCGQPAYNSGDRVTGKRLAKQMIEQFDGEVDKRMCKKALRSVIDSGRLTYKYAGGSYITLPEGS